MFVNPVHWSSSAPPRLICLFDRRVYRKEQYLPTPVDNCAIFSKILVVLLLQAKIEHNVVTNTAKFEIEGDNWEVGYNHKGVLRRTCTDANCIRMHILAWTSGKLLSAKCVNVLFCRPQLAYQEEVPGHEASPVRCPPGCTRLQLGYRTQPGVPTGARGAVTQSRCHCAHVLPVMRASCWHNVPALVSLG